MKYNHPITEEIGIELDEFVLADMSPPGHPKKHLIDGKVGQFQWTEDNEIIVRISSRGGHNSFPESSILRVVCRDCGSRKLYNETEKKWFCPVCES